MQHQMNQVFFPFLCGFSKPFKIEWYNLCTHMQQYKWEKKIMNKVALKEKYSWNCCCLDEMLCTL